jgi:hypothetical protein
MIHKSNDIARKLELWPSNNQSNMGKFFVQ